MVTGLFCFYARMLLNCCAPPTFHEFVTVAILPPPHDREQLPNGPSTQRGGCTELTGEEIGSSTPVGGTTFS